MFTICLTSLLLYQLFYLSKDFLSFNTKTKIDIKCNENDFNYPFITFNIYDYSPENINHDIMPMTYHDIDEDGYDG